MNNKQRYFKIGIFVISGLSILVIFLISLGAGVFEEDGLVVETYVDESVQGLEVGSPIKFRGVKVGSVEEIAFVGTQYVTTPDKARFVMLRSELNYDSLSGMSSDTLDQFIDRNVKDGMRVRVAAQGITGLAYLEIDYMDPTLSPQLEIDWEPKGHYLPSAPNRVTLIAESLEKISVGLERSNIENIANNVNQLIKTLDSTVEELRMNDVIEEATTLLAEARKTNSEIKALIQSEEVKAIQTNTVEVTETANRVISDVESQVGQTLNEFQATVTNLNDTITRVKNIIESERIDKALENFEKTSVAANRAAEGVPQTLEDARRTMNRLDLMLSMRQEDLRILMQDLKVITDNLRSTTGVARRYPSYTIFGEKPAPVKDAQ